MRGWVCLLLTLLTIALTSGLMPAAAALDGCADGCPGDEKSGTCAPDCSLCGCCRGIRPGLVDVSPTLVAPQPVGLATIQIVPPLPMPEPREIAHVPRVLS